MAALEINCLQIYNLPASGFLVLGLQPCWCMYDSTEDFEEGILLATELSSFSTFLMLIFKQKYSLCEPKYSHICIHSAHLCLLYRMLYEVVWLPNLIEYHFYTFNDK